MTSDLNYEITQIIKNPHKKIIHNLKSNDKMPDNIRGYKITEIKLEGGLSLRTRRFFARFMTESKASDVVRRRKSLSDLLPRAVQEKLRKRFWIEGTMFDLVAITNQVLAKRNMYAELDTHDLLGDGSVKGKIRVFTFDGKYKIMIKVERSAPAKTKRARHPPRRKAKTHRRK